MVLRPDGAQRAKSSSGGDLDRELFFDSEGNLLGPSESRAPSPGELEQLLDQSDPDFEPSTEQEMHAVVLGWVAVLAALAVGAAVPVVKRKFTETIEARKSRRARRDREGPHELEGKNIKKGAVETAPRTQDALTSQAPFSDVVEGLIVTPAADSTSDIDVTEGPILTMNAEEYREHARLVAKIRAWLMQYIDMLNRAVVVDAPNLTPQLREAINLIVEGRGHELDQDTLGQLAEFFHDEPEPIILSANEDPAV